MGSEVLEFGDFRLDPQQRCLARLDGTPVTLTARPLDVLLYLVEHAGTPVSRKTLLAAVWPNTIVEDNNLSQVVSKLRSTLGPGYIVTLSGRGFQFVREVHVARCDASAPAAVDNGKDSGRGAGTAPPQRDNRQSLRVAAVITAGLVMLIGAYMAFERSAPDQAITSESDTVSVLQATPSIAVLPFTDLSAQGDQAYFSDGLAEEILNQLAQLDGLLVIARSSSFAFRGQDPDVRTIGEALRVSHLLEGSVRKEGNRLRITAQLVDTSSRANAWSQSYDRELDDVFDVQQEIAQAVAQALSVSMGLGTTRLARSLPERDLEIYDSYLRARALLNSGTEASFERAEFLLRDILARAPDYHPARAALVQAYGLMLNLVPTRTDEVVGLLEALVEESTRQAPDDWSTHFGAAYLHMLKRQWVEADRAFARAEALAPASQPEASWERGDLLLKQGRATDTAELLAATLRIDPLQLDQSYALQMALTALGRTQEAEAEYRRSLDIVGDHQAIEHLALMRVWRSDDKALIRSRFDRYLDAQLVRSSWLSQERDAFDDSEAVRAVIRNAYADPANQDNLRLFVISLHASRHGDAELVLTALRRMLIDQGGISVQVLWYPDMADIRRLPAFKTLVLELGLVDYWRETEDWGDFCAPLGADDFECF